jgi:hypothetical protein
LTLRNFNGSFASLQSSASFGSSNGTQCCVYYQLGVLYGVDYTDVFQLAFFSFLDLRKQKTLPHYFDVDVDVDVEEFGLMFEFQA